MRQILGVFVLIFFALRGGNSLSCRKCDKSRCPKDPMCKGGYVTDICECCNVCAKLKGEVCGGLWNIKGKCDKGLTCVPKKKPPLPNTGLARPALPVGGHDPGYCACEKVVCEKYCKYGRVRDNNGCPSCTCMGSPSRLLGETCDKTKKCANGMVCQNSKCICIKVCRRRRGCPNGYYSDKYGCPICKCKPLRKLGQTCDNKKKKKCARNLYCINGICAPNCHPCFVNPCSMCKKNEYCTNHKCTCKRKCRACPIPKCKRKCKNGYRKNRKGCQTCQCKSIGKKGDKCDKKMKCVKGLSCKRGKCACSGVMCRRYCKNGFMNGRNGCPICKCRKERLRRKGELCNKKKNMKCARGLVCMKGKCACSGRMCKLGCPNGFRKGRNGCPICRCKPLRRKGQSCNNNKKKKCMRGLKCKKEKCACSGKICRRYCKNGFMNSRNGCPICKCRKERLRRKGERCNKKKNMKCARGLVCRKGKCACSGRMCKLGCPNGFRKGRNGCPICRCKPLRRKGQSCNNKKKKCMRGLKCKKGKCACSGRMCKLGCPNGFRKGRNGCPICRCKPLRRKGQSCNNKKKKCMRGLKCKKGKCACSGQICKRRCPNGFLNGRNGCPICKCRKERLRKKGERCDEKKSQQCVHGLVCRNGKCDCSGVMCMMYCENGFMNGPTGCPICKCKLSKKKEITTNE